MDLPVFRTVTILHTNEDTPWCDYVARKFISDKLDLKIETLNVTVLDYENPAEIQNAVKESYVVMLLTSCYFLEYMEQQAPWLNSMLESRDKGITTIVAATLHISSEELTLTTEQCHYNIDQQWEIMEIPVSGDNIMKCILDILEIVDRNSASRAKRTPARANSFPADLASLDATESVEIIPNTVGKAGEKVALIFYKEKVKGSVTVHSGNMKIPIEIVNPYCVTFKAPEITGTKILLQIDVNDSKLCYRKLYGRKPPEFSSVELMCQMYGVTKKDDLDIKLSEMFTSSLCADRHAMKIFTDIVEDTSIGRHSQYPTLLHWAAANGLKELCSALLSAPGANNACNILNRDKYDVSDLADINNYKDLAELITEFTEAKEIADVCDLYVQSCKAKKESPLYEVMLSNEAGGKSTGPPIVPRTPKSDKVFQLPPPRLSSSSSSEDDGNYVTPDPILPVGAIGSRSQTELIEIQEEVKRGTFSIKEAEMLFSSWKARYETGNAISFKDRQQSLQALRVRHQKTINMLASSKGKEQQKRQKKKATNNQVLTISEPVGMRLKSRTKASSLPGHGRGDSGTNRDRDNHDSGRFSGRDSTNSQTSTSSEDAEFEPDRSFTRKDRSQSEKAAARSTDYRLSKRNQYLELTQCSAYIPENSPPPLPPRMQRPPPTEVKRPPNIAQKPQLPLPGTPAKPVVPDKKTKVFIK